MPKLRAADKSSDEVLKLRFCHIVKLSNVENLQKQIQSKVLVKHFAKIIKNSHIADLPISISRYEFVVRRGPGLFNASFDFSFDPSVELGSASSFSAEAEGYSAVGFMGGVESRNVVVYMLVHNNHLGEHLLGTFIASKNAQRSSNLATGSQKYLQVNI